MAFLFIRALVQTIPTRNYELSLIFGTGDTMSSLYCHSL